MLEFDHDQYIMTANVKKINRERERESEIIYKRLIVIYCEMNNPFVLIDIKNKLFHKKKSNKFDGYFHLK